MKTKVIIGIIVVFMLAISFLYLNQVNSFTITKSELVDKITELEKENEALEKKLTYNKDCSDKEVSNFIQTREEQLTELERNIMEREEKIAYVNGIIDDLYYLHNNEIAYVEWVFPYEWNEISSVSIHKGKERNEVEVHFSDIENTVFNVINYLPDYAKAKINFDELLNTEPLYIRFHINNSYIEYPYFPSENILFVEGVAFYPSYELYSLGKSIEYADTIIGDFNKKILMFYDKAYEKEISDIELVNVNNKTEYDWYEELDDENTHSWIKETPNFFEISRTHYIDLHGCIANNVLYSNGIAIMNNFIVFSSGEFSINNQITIGSSKEEVISLYGEVEDYNNNIWRFYVESETGDIPEAIGFVFEDNVVKYVFYTFGC